MENKIISVCSYLNIIIEDDGSKDPTGILSLNLLDKKGKTVGSLPIIPSDVPELVKALTIGALELEKKGTSLVSYDAGYKDAQDSREPELEVKYPNL